MFTWSSETNLFKFIQDVLQFCEDRSEKSAEAVKQAATLLLIPFAGSENTNHCRLLVNLDLNLIETLGQILCSDQ